MKFDFIPSHRYCTSLSASSQALFGETETGFPGDSAEFSGFPIGLASRYLTGLQDIGNITHLHDLRWERLQVLPKNQPWKSIHHYWKIPLPTSSSGLPVTFSSASSQGRSFSLRPTLKVVMLLSFQSFQRDTGCVRLFYLWQHIQSSYIYQQWKSSVSSPRLSSLGTLLKANGLVMAPWRSRGSSRVCAPPLQQLELERRTPPRPGHVFCRAPWPPSGSTWPGIYKANTLR